MEMSSALGNRNHHIGKGHDPPGKPGVSCLTEGYPKGSSTNIGSSGTLTVQKGPVRMTVP